MRNAGDRAERNGKVREWHRPGHVWMTQLPHNTSVAWVTHLIYIVDSFLAPPRASLPAMILLKYNGPKRHCEWGPCLLHWPSASLFLVLTSFIKVFSSILETSLVLQLSFVNQGCVWTRKCVICVHRLEGWWPIMHLFYVNAKAFTVKCIPRACIIRCLWMR